MKTNHHACIDTSDRLQKALALLKDGRWHTSFEISRVASTVAAGSTISELRTNGFAIEHKYLGMSNGGRKVPGYRLAEQGQMELL